jgi:(1->4)-alpha-D-glucan 1-alpha-D-glucosylmutase
LLRQSPEVKTFLDETIRRFNGTVDDPRSFDLLDELLSEQAYRVAFWRVAGEEINYRRFFDINELAAIRMEDPDVFADTHRFLLRLVGAGQVGSYHIRMGSPRPHTSEACNAVCPRRSDVDRTTVVAEKI